MSATLPPVRVMIVDDSTVVRMMLRRALEERPEIRVVAVATNGEEAITVAPKQEVDIILLDIEMPKMNGIDALPLLLKASPRSKIIMSSSLTLKGADVSMRALTLGAVDYVAKPSAKAEGDQLSAFFHELISKVVALGRCVQADANGNLSSTVRRPTAAPVRRAAPAVLLPINKGAYPTLPPKALAIASSTGGPQALLHIFKALGGKLQGVPIFITQHMPPKFTTIFAENLSAACGRECVEGAEGMLVEPGKVYVAPGDYHMTVQKRDDTLVIKLNQGPMVNYCRPSAEPMLESLIDVFGRRLLLTVLTGMGNDGVMNAKKLSQAGGKVAIQDEKSCVVWGMPKAIADAGVDDVQLPLEDIANYLIRAFGER